MTNFSHQFFWEKMTHYPRQQQLPHATTIILAIVHRCASNSTIQYYSVPYIYMYLWLHLQYQREKYNSCRHQDAVKGSWHPQHFYWHRLFDHQVERLLLPFHSQDHPLCIDHCIVYHYSLGHIICLYPYLMNQHHQYHQLIHVSLAPLKHHRRK